MTSTDMPLGHTIGVMRLDPERVKTRRAALGLTQDQLAERTGMTQGAISRIESGRLSGAMRDTQDKLAVALQTTPDYLCGAPEPSQDSESQHSQASQPGPVSVPAHRPRRQRTCGDLELWPSGFRGARQLRPGHQTWTWFRLYRSNPLLTGPPTALMFARLADLILELDTPPTPEEIRAAEEWEQEQKAQGRW